MAVSIVVALEVVDIDHQDGERSLFSDRPLPFRLYIFVEMFPVAHSGECVDIVQPLQLEIRLRELLLTLAQGTVGLVAAELVPVGLRVIADPGKQFDLVRELDQIVVGAGRESLTLYRRLFLG